MDEDWWPRLLQQEERSHYLRTDFTRWKDEDDSDTDEPDAFNLKDKMNKMGGVEDGEEIEKNSDDDDCLPVFLNKTGTLACSRANQLNMDLL
ncbi:Hypothetical predicted protein [Octopus vulgaris]|uniref:Uncharacterized protein n=1 Tax=Octopus vulgaris TaxID=6645 RepID=A0AA36BCU3_OCTVU|nr:Hypothetical predicted protein [Octopus vulgaris]